jgi:hypothetical protein
MIYVLIENDATKVSRIDLREAADMYADDTMVDYSVARDLFNDPANAGCVYQIGDKMIGIVKVWD